MKRFSIITRSLTIAALLAGVSMPLFAAPKHGGSNSGGKSFSQSIQRSGSNSFSRSLPSQNNFKSQPLKIPLNSQTFNRSPVKQNLAPKTFAKPTSPIVGSFKPISPVKPISPLKPTNPIVGPLKPIRAIVGPVNPIVSPIKPINPIVGPLKPIRPIVGPIVGPINPPICPPPVYCPPYNPPHCQPHHHGWGWYPGFTVGIGLGGGYRNSSSTVVCQPVVLEVPVPVPAPVPAEELPVDPNAQPLPESASPANAAAATETVVAKLPQVRAGGTIELRGKELGEESGGVAIKVNDVILGCLVNDWKPDLVLATLPTVGIAAPTKAELAFILPNGKIAQTMQVELLPAETAEASQDIASRP